LPRVLLLYHHVAMRPCAGQTSIQETRSSKIRSRRYDTRVSYYGMLSMALKRAGGLACFQNVRLMMARIWGVKIIAIAYVASMPPAVTYLDICAVSSARVGLLPLGAIYSNTTHSSTLRGPHTNCHVLFMHNPTSELLRRGIVREIAHTYRVTIYVYDSSKPPTHIPGSSCGYDLLWR